MSCGSNRRRVIQRRFRRIRAVHGAVAPARAAGTGRNAGHPCGVDRAHGWACTRSTRRLTGGEAILCSAAVPSASRDHCVEGAASRRSSRPTIRRVAAASHWAQVPTRRLIRKHGRRMRSRSCDGPTTPFSNASAFRIPRSVSSVRRAMRASSWSACASNSITVGR